MLFDIFNVILCVLALLYFFTLMLLWLGLNRIPPGRNMQQPLVSVVIAARDEAHNIPGLVQSLRDQDYPPEQIEFILVDDRSEDDTADIFTQLTAQDDRFRLEKVRQASIFMAPKKNALDLGIKSAHGAIVLSTDADCRPVKTWVSTMVHYFDAEVGMVAGFSSLELPDTRSITRKLYALDSLALACVAAGSAGWDQMATCSGRNLAYRKEVYHQVGGFARIARFISGDDDLFLHLIQQETRWQIRYALDPGALIPAFSPENLSTFFHQRIRHASKGRHYGLKMTSMLAAVYLFNLFLFITIPAAIFGLGNALPLAILLLKCLFEFILLARMAEICAKIDLLRIFLLAELIHIPYVVAFGALGQFSKFRWKKSKHTARMPVKKITEAK